MTGRWVPLKALLLGVFAREERSRSFSREVAEPQRGSLG